MPRFRLLAREEGSFPSVAGKEFRAFPSHLKRRRSRQERQEELQGLATIPRVPQMSQSIPGKPVFPALFRLSSRGSTHTMVASESPVRKPRVKASWESLEGMQLIPCTKRREAGNCCYSTGGKRTPMPPLETMTDSPGESPELPKDPCQHWRGILMFRHRIHRRSYTPASTEEESREAPEQLAWGLTFPEATKAGP